MARIENHKYSDRRKLSVFISLRTRRCISSRRIDAGSSIGTVLVSPTDRKNHYEHSSSFTSFRVSKRQTISFDFSSYTEEAKTSLKLELISTKKVRQNSGGGHC